MTTVQDQTEWENMLEDMSQSVIPETYMRPGDIITRPGGEIPFAQRVQTLEYKGYCQLWDTRTGVESLCPWYLVPLRLQQRRQDGSLVFTRTDPKISQAVGADLKCPLHPKHPESARYLSMGFQPCSKQHIPHVDGLNRHIRKSHSRLQEVQERERHDRERAEDRELQRENLLIQQETLRLLTGGWNQAQDLPVESDSESPAAVMTVQHIEAGDGLCECGWQSQAKRKSYRKVSLRQHIASKI